MTTHWLAAIPSLPAWTGWHTITRTARNASLWGPA